MTVREVESGTFRGVLTVNGEDLVVGLVIDGGMLRITSGDAEVGRWPVDEVRISPLDSQVFTLVVDGETAAFRPADPESFRTATGGESRAAGAPRRPSPATPPPTAAEHPDTVPGGASVPPPASSPVPPPPESPSRQAETRPGASTATAAVVGPETPPAAEQAPSGEDPAARLRLRRPKLVVPTGEATASGPVGDVDGDGKVTMADLARSAAGRRDHSKVALIAAGVVVALALLTVGALAFLGGSDGDADAPAVTVTTTPTSSTASSSSTSSTTTVTVPASGVSAAEVVAAWNELAAQYLPGLALPSTAASSSFVEEFGDYLVVEGEVDPGSGELRRLVYRANPAGNAAVDRAILVGLGIAVGAADPSLDAPGRAEALARMGFDVNDPQVAGLDSTTTQAGMQLRIYWDDSNQLLVLEMAPAPVG